MKLVCGSRKFGNKILIVYCKIDNGVILIINTFNNDWQLIIFVIKKKKYQLT